MTAQDNTFYAEFDVVVVGSGVAALFGAATAAARGLSTCLIEKTDRFGGTSAYSGGAVWLPGNSVLARDGVEDSVERGRTYFRAVVGDRTAADVQDAFLNTGPQVVEFLQDELGIPTRFQAFPDYFDAPGRQELGRSIYPKPIKGEEVGDRATDIRPPVPADQFGADEDTAKLEGGRAWVARLVLALDSMDTAETRLNTAAEELVRDDDGRVVGVVVNGVSGRQVLGARRGVLVAAGGFERSADLRRRWQDMPTADWSSSHPATGSGDAVRMFEQVGAELDLLDQSWWCPATLFPNGHAAFTLGFRSGIIVDGTGRRFANELLPYDQMGRKMHARMADGAGDEFWLVFDDAEAGGYPAICIPAPEPDALRGRPVAHRGIRRGTGRGHRARSRRVARERGPVQRLRRAGARRRLRPRRGPVRAVLPGCRHGRSVPAARRRRPAPRRPTRPRRPRHQGRCGHRRERRRGRRGRSPYPGSLRRRQLVRVGLR